MKQGFLLFLVEMPTVRSPAPYELCLAKTSISLAGVTLTAWECLQELAVQGQLQGLAPE